MKILHHPSEDSVMAYAGGALAPTLALALRTHLDGCVECRRNLGLAEALGGAFLEDQSPAEWDERAFAKLLPLLDAPIAEAAPPPKAESGMALPPSLAHQPIGTRRWLAPGIWIRPILKDRREGTRVYLLGAAPGKALPRHGHAGVEMTQVLTGEFFDGDTRYGPGDFLEASSEVEHALRVGADEECICVIASQGVPLGLPGLLMRLLA